MQTLLELESQWNDQGFAVIDNFLTPITIKGLRELAEFYWTQGSFAPAKVGHSQQADQIQEIRGDSTLWVDPKFKSLPLLRYLESMTALKQYFNQWLFAGIVDLECHFAKYPIGTFYKAHYDRFENKDTRILSAVLYLNPEDWQESDGGFLRIFPKNNEVCILPQGGRLVLFDSATLLHEVLPTQRERWSLTGWFLRRDYRRMDLPLATLNGIAPQFEKGSIWGHPAGPPRPQAPKVA